ncbi:peptidoglycan-binding domain-containing protein [Collinsella sp. UBA1693]|uniref:peptidoglycan-binding domain-containing protein n=1 Tax=Collinsella sp. UBA1693 TaxID=1946385 RepID=UPI00257ACC00|nr:peptidoglycan-binding protein [Collinsella sp. UBA1693]
MDSIKQGMQGPAVEDVQTRLASLGYAIDEHELEGSDYGASTAKAVSDFRVVSGLATGDEVDSVCWSALVDASYKLGDRTLYLRLPNFHGADVRALQQALNVLGFACGIDDGYFGPHTEAALQQFQENVGLFADGMAFQDTFNYIKRLHHVWKDKPSVVNIDSEARSGFARAASVLEHVNVAVGGEDAIARNIASRIWNIASATTENSGVVLYDSEEPQDMDVIFVLASEPPPESAAPVATITLAECTNLSQRIRTAIAASTQKPARVRFELTGLTRYGTFTSSDAQTLAIRLLDGVCDALSA